MASGRIPRTRSTLPIVLILAICWIFLLLMVSNLSENVWYLVTVGGLGMVQNLFAAGHSRNSSALGVHLSEPDIILPSEPKKDKNGFEMQNKVFQVLKKTEVRMFEKYGVKRVGVILLSVFFPDGLRPHETEWKQQQEARYDKLDEAIRIRNQEVSEKGLHVEQTSTKAGRGSLPTQKSLSRDKIQHNALSAESLNKFSHSY